MTELSRDELDAMAGALRQATYRLDGAPSDYDPILDLVGDHHFVLIGEASHGTHEFYHTRAEITKRLIEEKGFTAVAVEADWPDAYRVNRYVQGRGDGATAVESLSDFKRFPTWMWRNADVLDFVGWLREHNADRSPKQRVGFYGLDLYSLYSSAEAVVNYLEKVDPEAAQRARYRYSCFEHFGEDPQSYGYAASFNMSESCEREAIKQLIELRQQATDFLRRDGFVAEDEFFFAEQNARVVKNAEEYYRQMFGGRVSTWNLRDTHMFDTLQALVQHQRSQNREPRIVVWEHNSHVGDARATQMGQRGELNVGQLARQAYGADAVLLGYTTYTGTVTAASGWGGAAERKHVRPAMAGSYELIFHQVEGPDFVLRLRGGHRDVGAVDALQHLRRERLERAIGVIYLPQSERTSHYFYARLPDQFDAVLHFDETRAVEPLERTAGWEEGEVPDLYPFGV